jgi:DNA-binding CsgD family transcriptional regulator
MSKSSLLRPSDCRSILKLIGECRDLGDDRDAWRIHFVEHLAGLVDADIGSCGEMACEGPGVHRSVGVCHWGYENWASPDVLGAIFEATQTDPDLYRSIVRYFRRLMRDDGICLSRRQVIDDRDWYGSPDFLDVHRTFGMDHILWCFGSVPDRAGSEFGGVVLYRAIGRRDFGARELSIVREAHAGVAALLGGPLARFHEPSPRDLSPRVRQVLAGLLDGEADKQIAARLGLSGYTVNQHTKRIFRHFGVNGRPELLARWIRRGWGGRFPWRP